MKVVFGFNGGKDLGGCDLNSDVFTPEEIQSVKGYIDRILDTMCECVKQQKRGKKNE